MDANGIIGREYEQKLIQERCKSNKAELIAIYGLLTTNDLHTSYIPIKEKANWSLNIFRTRKVFPTRLRP